MWIWANVKVPFEPAGVTGSCESSNLGPGNRVQVLWKSNILLTSEPRPLPSPPPASRVHTLTPLTLHSPTSSSILSRYPCSYNTNTLSTYCSLGGKSTLPSPQSPRPSLPPCLPVWKIL